LPPQTSCSDPASSSAIDTFVDFDFSVSEPFDFFASSAASAAALSTTTTTSASTTATPPTADNSLSASPDWLPDPLVVDCVDLSSASFGLSAFPEADITWPALGVDFGLDLGDTQSISVPTTANNTPADLDIPLQYTGDMALPGILDAMIPALGMDHHTAHLFSREAMDQSFHHAFTSPNAFSAIPAPARSHSTSSPSSSAHHSDSHSPVIHPSAGGIKRKHPSPSVSLGDRSPPDQHTISDGALDEEEAVTVKRQRNTLAARRYRQKRLDRISDLEKALSDVSGERDDLKLQLARREAEVSALREMLAAKK
jgi:hypothetical protein